MTQMGSEFCILRCEVSIAEALLALGLVEPQSALLLAWIHNLFLLLATVCDPLGHFYHFHLSFKAIGKVYRLVISV